MNRTGCACMPHIMCAQLIVHTQVMDTACKGAEVEQCHTVKDPIKLAE